MQVRPRVKQWKPFEVELRARRAHANPYLDVEVWADVTGPDGQPRKVYGFWDGDTTWRVRFAPMAPGEWRWVTRASVDDPGLVGQSGAVECVAPTAEEIAANPLNRGFIRAQRRPALLRPRRRYAILLAGRHLLDGRRPRRAG